MLVDCFGLCIGCHAAPTQFRNIWPPLLLTSPPDDAMQQCRLYLCCLFFTPHIVFHLGYCSYYSMYKDISILYPAYWCIRVRGRPSCSPYFKCYPWCNHGRLKTNGLGPSCSPQCFLYRGTMVVFYKITRQEESLDYGEVRVRASC